MVRFSLLAPAKFPSRGSCAALSCRYATPRHATPRHASPRLWTTPAVASSCIIGRRPTHVLLLANSRRKAERRPMIPSDAPGRAAARRTVSPLDNRQQRLGVSIGKQQQVGHVRQKQPLPSSLPMRRSSRSAPFLLLSPIRRGPVQPTPTLPFTTAATPSMRIPYAPAQPADPTPEHQAIYDRIRERRKPRPLIPLDLAILHNPSIADGFNTLLGAIRTKSSFPLPLAELAICYIAVLNKATYEWNAHAPIYLKSGGRRDALSALLEGRLEGLTEEERAICEFTRASTKEVEINDEVFEAIRQRFSDRQISELMMTVAGYNMVSRVLVGLDVTESNGKEMKVPEEAKKDP